MYDRRRFKRDLAQSRKAVTPHLKKGVGAPLRAALHGNYEKELQSWVSMFGASARFLLQFLISVVRLRVRR